VKREISPSLKFEWKAELLGACKNPSGYPAIDEKTGCQFHYGTNDPLRECECLILFSCMHRHADFGFDPTLFRHDIETILVDDRGPLDRYLTSPERVWREGRGMYIWGEDIGIGKTTLAHLVVRHLYRWLYRSSVPNGPAEWSSLATAIHNDYLAWYMLSGDVADRAHWKGRDGFREVLANWSEGDSREIDILTANLLCIDELGRENRDERRAASGREMMEQMLRERRNGRGVTILIGHDSPDQFRQRHGDHIESLMANMSIVKVSSANGDRRRPLSGNRGGW